MSVSEEQSEDLFNARKTYWASSMCAVRIYMCVFMCVYEHRCMYVLCMHVCIYVWDVCQGREKRWREKQYVQSEIFGKEKKELLKPNKRTTKKKPERWEEKTEVCTRSHGGESFIGELWLGFSSKSRYWNK